MSWLLVGLIPGLLMLATFGLDRLEAGLDADTVSATDVAALLAQARADCAKPAVHDVRRAGEPPAPEYVIFASAQDRPTRVLIDQRADPGFRPTRHAHRV